MSLSNNIKFLRERHGLTQVDLAEIAGVSDKAVSTWENGTYQPRMGVIEKLCEHFNIPKSSLLDSDLESEFEHIKKPALQEDGLSAEKREFMELIMKMNEKEFAAIQRIVNSVLEEFGE